MNDQMKQRLYRLRKKLKTCDDWEVEVLKQEIKELENYLDWRDKAERNAGVDMER